MKLLVVHPGASYATGDVHRGYCRALRAAGHTVLEYALDKRIDDINDYYRFVYRKRKLGLPTSPLILTKAGADILPQAVYHEVDGVLCISLMYLAPDFLVLLRRVGIPTAALFTESPYDTAMEARVAPWVDVAFTNERTSVGVLRRAQPHTHYLPHAYDPALVAAPPPDDQEIPRHDVLFIGTYFAERLALLGGVDWDGIDLGLYGATHTIPSRHRLRRYIRGKIIDNALAQHYYRAARIVINPYRTSVGFGHHALHIAHAESLNPRALELAAAGVFHTSERRAEVAEVFGGLVPTYDSPQTLEAVLRHYLSHEEERDGQARLLPAAVRGHTYAARAADLMAHLAAAWSPERRKAS